MQYQDTVLVFNLSFFFLKKELVSEITELEKERDELEAKLKKVNG
jgi:hypothetical protein